MAAADTQRHRHRLVAIAPAPANGESSTNKPHPVMPYTCQPCAKRKVKCDKAAPICSSCRKSNLDCLYRAPTPRWRKRKLNEDERERLARYERILLQHGLLDAETLSPSNSIGETSSEEPISFQWNRSEGSRTGRILANHGKSRYIDSHFWGNFGDHEMQDVLDDEEDEEDQVVGGFTGDFITDPLTGAFLGSERNLFQYHPSHTEAMLLWGIHIENVEPLCKIVHIPSTTKMVETASQDPTNVSRSDDCLLFAIYHFAVFSITEEECIKQLGASRTTLMERYRFATRQALVNATFLKTTELSVLQALVLFLLPSRFFYDSHTYWILTGVAVRIAQRMGIHRDGETLGLPPFEVQMRRRLFYKLLPLDQTASQMAGIGRSAIPDGWDTRQPLNINDDQIWPGMTEPPKEQQGATELIFCLSRICIGNFLSKNGLQFKDYRQAEPVISQAESEVEEKYIRYCDVINPLHFLAICSARSGITAMRLFVRLPKFRNETATSEERRDMLQLAQKILDTDTAARGHASLGKYRWHTQLFFLWGTWDSLVFVLTSLWRSCDMLSGSEIDAAWTRVEHIYSDHDELLESKRALYVALGRLTLKAWDTHPPGSCVPEPGFIATLRSPRRVNSQGKTNTTSPDTMSLADPFSTKDEGEKFCNDIGFDLGDEFNLDGTDWAFWDHLMRKPQVQDQRDEFA